MSIEKRLERVEAILDARGLDWDHPRVKDDHFADANKMVAEEPPKKWRILEPGEVVQDGDWMNARVNSQEYSPPDGGWLAAPSFYFGKDASVASGLFFARTVVEEPAKEPEHPASEKPPEPEYREPVLPADAGKVCEFSDDDKTWRSGYLKGFDYDEHRHQGAGWRRNQNCSSDRARHRFARIKKDA